jgi:cholesterol oxidase
MWFKDKTQAVVQGLGPLSLAFDVPRQAGVLDVVGNTDMSVYVGRGVGGGSLVNMSIYVQPVRERLVRAFPRVDVDAMYGVYYPRALAMLRGKQVPQAVADADCYQYSRTAAEAAQAVGIQVESCTSGYDYAYMADEIANRVPRSALAAEAVYGHNYGKRSLDKTYLAEAMATGLLTILPLHEVTRIEQLPDATYVLSCREIDVDGQVIAQKQLKGTHVFCGGGSMGTSNLLVRAREIGTLPKLSREVGTSWGPNSDIFVMRANPVWTRTGSLQSTVPSVQFHTRDDDGRAVFSMAIPFPIGIETRLSFHLVMTDNPEAGKFVYNSASGLTELRWLASQNTPAVRSSRQVFDKINQRARSSYDGSFFGGPELSDRATYHPVGGCPLGVATDDFGRIPKYPGLYVTDGSLIPVGIGANPALTVTALAERNIERIIAEDWP